MNEWEEEWLRDYPVDRERVEAHKAQMLIAVGEERARERIIKIIENAIIDSEGYCHADTVIATINAEWQNDADTVSLLTEGENK